MTRTKNPAGGPGDGVKLSQCESIMRHLPDEVKTFPLPDTHLHGAAVLCSSLLSAEAHAVDLAETARQLREVADSLPQAIRWFLTEAEDIFSRYETALQLATAGRAPAMPPKQDGAKRLPGWFFQAESNDPRAMLIRRARYLRVSGADVDRAWDTLKEFCASCNLAIAEDDMAGIVQAAYAGKGGR